MRPIPPIIPEAIAAAVLTGIISSALHLVFTASIGTAVAIGAVGSVFLVLMFYVPRRPARRRKNSRNQ
jgi:membrane protease YdiL (CAAX protease family)